MHDRWEAKKQWVNDKIGQAERAQAALKAGDKAFLGLDPKEVMLLSLRIAIGDCKEALDSPDAPAFLKKWFYDAKWYCQALIKEQI